MADSFTGKIDVTDYTVDGRCSGCGACCSDYLPLSIAEIGRIRKYMRKRNLREHTASVMAGQSLDMTCPFRDNVKRRCDIYEVRPDICRAFQCDQPVEMIGRNKEWFHLRNRVVSMRGEFFGNARSAVIAATLEQQVKRDMMKRLAEQGREGQ